MELGRPWDRYDPGLLRQHPGECELRTRDALALRKPSDELDQRLVRFSRFRGEPRQVVAEIGAVDFRVLVDGAGEKPPAERAEGYEPDAELCERREELSLGLAPPEGILAL